MSNPGRISYMFTLLCTLGIPIKNRPQYGSSIRLWTPPLFTVNNLYINITLSRVVTRFWFVRKPSHWNEVISCVRTTVVALGEPVPTPSSCTPCVTRVLSSKRMGCAFLQHSAVPLVLPSNRNKLALMKQSVIHDITKNYSYNNWSCHVTYLFFQLTFYADTSCPSSKPFFVIYASWIRLLLHHGDPDSSYYNCVTSMKLHKSDFH